MEEVEHMQVLKEIYQVGGSLNGITYGIKEDASYDDCNTYVLKTKEGLYLFDCGCGDTLDQIYENMKYWNLDPNYIKGCFITHSHLDHAGAAYLLSKQGIPLYAHKNAAQAMEAGDERCCGYLYHKTYTPCKVDFVLSDGDVVDLPGMSVKACHMPGHTMGCTAYMFEHDQKKIVVSGDIIGTLLDGYFGWSGSFDFDKTVYLETLKRFAKVESDVMLPGHGMIYFHKPKRRVEDALNMALMQWR